jgi:hypothetical protein
VKKKDEEENVNANVNAFTLIFNKFIGLEGMGGDDNKFSLEYIIPTKIKLLQWKPLNVITVMLSAAFCDQIW